MTVDNRAAMVGQYTTAGLGGGVEAFYMPEGITSQMTVSRAVDADGNIFLEGVGVVPTVKVPVNEDTLFNDGDPTMDAAVNYLNDALAYDVLESGSLQIGDVLTASIRPKTRLHYTLSLPAGTSTSIVLEGDGQIDPVLNLYDETGQNLLASNDDSSADTLNAALEDWEAGDQDLNVVVEVATARDQDQGTFSLRIEDVAAEATPTGS